MRSTTTSNGSPKTTRVRAAWGGVGRARPAGGRWRAACRRSGSPRRQADRLPSVAAAVVHKGEQVWANAVGSADYDEDRGATPDTQYRIGSITKTFTATAIMQLRDAGQLD